MQVAGYIRVSTEQQRDEGSHENQRDRLETWADRHDHELTIFEDIAISGQADDRPEYEAMMSQLGEYDAPGSAGRSSVSCGTSNGYRSTTWSSSA